MTDSQPCAVIFDMDGVLIDSEPVYMKMERQLFDSVGARISEAEHQRYVGAPVATLWSLVVERASRPCTAEQLHELNHKKIRSWLEAPGPLEPMPGARALLERLATAHIPLAVASLSSPRNIETILQRLGFRQFFAVVVSGHEVAAGKPAPDIFLEAARRLGVQSKRCVVIEDSHCGVTAAGAAGMRCVALRNAYMEVQALQAADRVVDALTSLTVEDLLGPCRTGNSSPRVSSAHRDRVIERLSHSYVYGQISEQEFERRLTAAHEVTRHNELAALVADLSPAGIEPQSVDGETESGALRKSQTVIAILGGSERRGTWRPARRIQAVAVMGGVDLDFRRAIIPAGVTELVVICVMGGVDIIVPPEVNVEVSGAAILGGFEDSCPTAAPGAPTLRVRGIAVMGGVSVTQNATPHA